MRIIVEGCDGCGKSTLVDRLVKEYGLDIIQMTREGSKKKFDYVQKSFMDNMVSDRSFISEYVYSNVYQRMSEINDDVMNWMLVQYRDWVIITLVASPETIAERVKSRGTDTEKFDELVSKVESYKAMYKKHLQNKDRCIMIDTDGKTPEEVFNIAKEFIDEQT